MANVKKKPTAKEMASAIIEINNKVNELHNIMRSLDNVVGLYIRMNGDLEKFNEYIQQETDKAKEGKNDEEANGEADKPNLQRDTDGESSGSEGVRKKAK